MVRTAETVRVYLNTDRQGMVICIHCGVKRPINMSNHTDSAIGGKSLKVKCNACGKIFHIRFDLRRYHRINVNLRGKILQLPARKTLGSIIVVSLSVNSIGFIMNDNYTLKCHGIYEVIFQLDDDHHSIICEEVVVKRINGSFVGAEFHNSNRYSHELDFYTMSDL